MIDFVLANSAVPKEMPNYAPFYLRLHPYLLSLFCQSTQIGVSGLQIPHLNFVLDLKKK